MARGTGLRIAACIGVLAATTGGGQAAGSAFGGIFGGGGGSYQSCVIAHESSGDPQAVNSSSGAGGLYQFLPSTWASTPEGAAYPGGAQTAPKSVQDAAFRWEYRRYGSAPWSTDGC